MSRATAAASDAVCDCIWVDGGGRESVIWVSKGGWESIIMRGITWVNEGVYIIWVNEGVYIIWVNEGVYIIWVNEDGWDKFEYQTSWRDEVVWAREG